MTKADRPPVDFESRGFSRLEADILRLLVASASDPQLIDQLERARCHGRTEALSTERTVHLVPDPSARSDDPDLAEVYGPEIYSERLPASAGSSLTIARGVPISLDIFTYGVDELPAVEDDFAYELVPTNDPPRTGLRRWIPRVEGVLWWILTIAGVVLGALAAIAALASR